MAKKQQPQPKIENRRHKALSRKDADTRRKIILAFSGLAGLLILILAAGAFYTYVQQPNRPIAIVNGEKITRQDYQHRVLYERYLLDEQMNYLQVQYQQLAASLQDSPDLLKSIEGQANQQLNQLAAQRAGVDRAALDLLIEEHLVAAEAANRGLSVSEEEVTQTYNQIAAARSGGYTQQQADEILAARQDATATALSFTPTPTPEGEQATAPDPTPAPTPTIHVVTGAALSQAVADWETIVRDKAGMLPEDVRHQVRMQLLKDKVREAVGQEADPMALQAHVRHLLVATEEEAQAAKARINAGEAFEDVAAEVSLDTGSALEGGDLGWFSQGTMVTEFDDAAFSLEINALSEPVETQFGWHIIQVLAREERELTGADLSRKQTEAYAEWLRGQYVTVEDLWTADDVPPDENNPLAAQAPQAPIPARQ